MRKMEHKSGFTLAELLIVVAVIGVLVAVAMPVFGRQLEKSRQAVDVANMRNAYAVAVADFLSDGRTGKFSYDAASNALLDSGSPDGYGRSSAEVDWTTVYSLPFQASGIANSDGVAHVLSVTVADDGAVSMTWGGFAKISSGNKILKGNTYTVEQRIFADEEMLNVIQEKIRNMTAGELRQYFIDVDPSLADATSIGLGSKIFQSTNDKNNHRSAAILASSRTTQGTYTYNPDPYVKGTSAFWNQVLKDAGLDTDAINAGEEYILSSIDTTDTTHLKVALGKSFENYSDDEKLSDAVVYIQQHDTNKSPTQDWDYSYSERKAAAGS